MAKRVHVVLKGRVQNVGFRVFLLQAAQRLRLSGWVRNLPSGHVELEAEGDDQAVDELVALARRGPRLARVDQALIEPRAPLGEEPPEFAMR
ncbi:MAG TPA: acylphosphatase [Chloroflexota bacterium]|jgi:acylphosphatase|nr:acylphosphatase [Chloroflexota bacterium]